ncbi:equistatin-like [Oculina patagonica]
MLSLLILATALALSNAATKCEELSSQASANGLVGAFVPQCKADGSFKSEQCWGSTGYCWCVDEFGKEIPGTKLRGTPDCSKKGVLTLCQSLQAIIVNLPGWCGPPQCKPDGSFEEVQCCASTGKCYCVDREGKKVKGTEQNGKPDCESHSSKCEKTRLDALANGPLLGQYVPHCRDDGSFEPAQCWASTGYCWCVDQDGEKKAGSTVRFKHPGCQ